MRLMGLRFCRFPDFLNFRFSSAPATRGNTRQPSRAEAEACGMCRKQGDQGAGRAERCVHASNWFPEQTSGLVIDKYQSASCAI